MAAGSGGSIAGKTGMSKGSISEFRSGKKTPGVAARAKLVKIGIPAESWDVAPRAAAALEDDPELADTGEAGIGLRSIADIRAELEAHVRRIRRTLVPDPGTPELSEGETTKRMNAHTMALRALAQVRQDEDLFETRIIFEHPAFKRVFDVVFRVLKRHPKLAREIQDALRAEQTS